MSNHARRERLLLVDLLESVGPEAPTLCEGWNTRDLASHIVVRERRPTAAAGLMIKSLAPRLARVQAEYAARPYEELLELIRTGPPVGLYRIPGADELANTMEYFIHGEDVRRAQSGWAPRVLDPEFSESLWKNLARSASMSGRRSPTGMVLRRPNGQTVVAHKGAPVVTVTGEPGELVIFASGRQASAQVELDGDPEAVTKLQTAQLA